MTLDDTSANDINLKIIVLRRLDGFRLRSKVGSVASGCFDHFRNRLLAPLKQAGNDLLAGKANSCQLLAHDSAASLIGGLVERLVLAAMSGGDGRKSRTQLMRFPIFTEATARAARNRLFPLFCFSRSF